MTIFDCRDVVIEVSTALTTKHCATDTNGNGELRPGILPRRLQYHFAVFVVTANPFHENNLFIEIVLARLKTALLLFIIINIDFFIKYRFVKNLRKG